jgi:hypothetical protein
LLKSNLNWRRLNLVMLLLVSISVVITLIILMITRPGVFSSHTAANTPAENLPQAMEPATAQVELTTPKSSESDAVSNSQKEVSAPIASTSVAKPEGAIEAQKKFSEAANSEPSQRVAVAQLNIARKVLRQDAKSIASKAAIAGEGSKRATSPKRVHVDDSRSESLVSRGEASSLARNEMGQAKAESKSAPATGGGQRPRRVTSRAP